MTTTTAGRIQYDIAAVKKRILRNLVDEAGNEIKDKQLEVYRNYGVALNPLTGLPQRQPKIPFWTAVTDLFESDQAVPCMIPAVLCWGDASYNEQTRSIGRRLTPTLSIVKVIVMMLLLTLM